MNLTTEQPDLKRALTLLKPAVAAKSTLPALSHVQLQAEDGQLRLAATDLSIALMVWIKADVNEPCGMCMPFGLLADLTGALPDRPIQWWHTEETQTMRLLCTLQHEANIKGIAFGEFPTLPAIDAAPLLTIASDELSRALDQVVYAAASDDTRPALAGVHIRIEPQRIVFSTSDGFRAGRSAIQLDQPIDGITEPIELLPQADALAVLVGILRGQDGKPLAIRRIGDSFVAFDVSDAAGVARFVLIARLIDGRYPELDRMIPSDFESRLVIDRAALVKAVKIASFFALASANIVRLAFEATEDGPGMVKITANAAEVGNNRSEVDSIVHGNRGRMALNVKFLAETLEVLTSNQVAIESQGEQYAAVFRPVGDEATLHILMPMTVRE